MKQLISFLVLITTLLAFLSSNEVQGAKILFYWATSGYSHRISAMALIDKLAEKGHEITFLSPYPSKNPRPAHPNITDMVPQNLARDLGIANIDFVTLRLTKGVSAINDLWFEYHEAGIRTCESLLTNPEVNKWIETSSFDLVIINALYNDCGFGLAYKFKAPHIIYSTTAVFQWWGDAHGFPEENYPEFQYHFNVNMTFGQSVVNTLAPLYWRFKRHYELFPHLEGLLKKHLKGLEDMPPLHELETNTSLIFANIHFSEEFARSLPPQVISIGGIHCKDEVKPLTKDILDFIESGGNKDFMYLSLGSYATLSTLPKHLQETFLGAMSKIKMKFIVKHDGETPKGLSKNIKLVKWTSQYDILGHPNIRGYIGHGGLLGIQEATSFGVPMIIMPLFAEQDYNAVRVHANERGILLEISEITADTLTSAINAILTDPKYKNNMKRLSTLFKDRPEKPVDTAVWWVEYVLRHKDLSHVRPIGIKRTWYQRRMLDIWAFIIVSIIGVFILMTLILYYVTRALFGSSSTNITATKNKIKKNKKSN